MARFIAKSEVSAMTVFAGGIFVGGWQGETFIIKVGRELICSDFGIVTVRKIWMFGQQQYYNPSTDCPFCGYRFEPEKKYIDTIKGILRNSNIGPSDSPCLKLDKEAWNESGLFSNCPKCHEKIRFNPFIVGGE